MNFNIQYCIGRHGESQMNVQGRIGGDANLSENGMEYAKVSSTHDSIYVGRIQ